MQVLGQVFRRIFLDELQKMCAGSGLRLYGPLDVLNTTTGFQRWERELPGPAWNVYVKTPPEKAQSRPENLLRYLGRYVCGTAISNHRLVSLEHDEVTFTVTSRETGQPEHRTLPAVTFLERFLMHIVPPGLHRIRVAGLLAYRDRADRLAHCRELIISATPITPTTPVTPTTGSESGVAVAQTASDAPSEPASVVTSASPASVSAEEPETSPRPATQTIPPPATAADRHHCEHCGSHRWTTIRTHPLINMFDLAGRIYGHLLSGRPCPTRTPLTRDTS